MVVHHKQCSGMLGSLRNFTNDMKQMEKDLKEAAEQEEVEKEVVECKTSPEKQEEKRSRMTEDDLSVTTSAYSFSSASVVSPNTAWPVMGNGSDSNDGSNTLSAKLAKLKALTSASLPSLFGEKSGAGIKNKHLDSTTHLGGG